MGNRAFIKFEGVDTGIYLHWNGGRDSVEPMLDYCKLKGYRFDEYGVARFAQVVGNYFGGGLSIGVYSTVGKSLADLDGGDNGVYIVNNWEIVGRYPRNPLEQKVYNHYEFMLDLDAKMPESEKVGNFKIREYLKAKKGEKENAGTEVV